MQWNHINVRMLLGISLHEFPALAREIRMNVIQVLFPSGPAPFGSTTPHSSLPTLLALTPRGVSAP